MYEIRKGWPSNGAIDEIFEADTGEVITPGMVASVDNTSGRLKVANYTAAAQDTDPMPAFVIGMEKVSGKITALMHQCVIEVDAEGYEADTYAVGDHLTSQAGKFKKVTGTGEKAIARVISFDAASGHLRLMWHESR